MEAHLIAQCAAYRKETVCYIADAYCGKYEFSNEITKLEIGSTGDTMENVELVRGVVEAARQPGSINSISVIPGIVYKSREGDKLELKTTVCVNVLYISEDGVLLSASKKIGVSSYVPYEADAVYTLAACVQGEPFAVISTDGIEVKFNLAFKAECERIINIVGVSAISIDTENPKDLSALPSIVVKRFTKADTLWKMAKKYSSVPDAILKANDLELGTEPETDSIIIIPKIR